MSIVCAISGDIPDTPVVSHVSGHVFEKRLLEKWVEDKGTDPVNNEPLSMEQTTEIKSSESVIRPRAPAWTSIPGILKCLQDEWDALMLHQYSLRDQLQNSRQELSHSLYQHDAACRVIARLQKDTAEAKDALSTLRPMAETEMYRLQNAAANGHGEMEMTGMDGDDHGQSAPGPSMPGPSGMDVAGIDEKSAIDDLSAGAENPIPLHVIEEIQKNNEVMSKERKKRQKAKDSWPNLAKQDEILNFSPNFDYAGFHSSSHPGITSIAIDEEQFPGHVLTAGVDKTACLFNCAEEKISKTLKGHAKKLTSAIIHPSEPMAITASVDQTVKLWALNSFEKFEGDTECTCLETFSNHKATVSDVSLHPITNYMFTVGYDGTWNFIDLPNSTVLTKVQVPDLEFTSSMVHPDGRIFSTGTNNGSKSALLIWDISERTKIHEFTGHTDAIESISFSDNGYLVATGSRDGTCKIWDLRKLTCRETLPIVEGETVHSVQFDASGHYLACSTGTDVTIYSTGKQWNQLSKLEGHKQAVTSLAWGKDAKCLYSSSLDNTVVKYYFDTEDQEEEEEEGAAEAMAEES